MAWTLVDHSDPSLRSLVSGIPEGRGDDHVGSGGWVGILENEEGGETNVTCTYTLSLVESPSGLVPAVEFHTVWIDEERGDDQLLFDTGLIDRVLDRVFIMEAAVAGHPDAESALRIQCLKWSLIKDGAKEFLGSREDSA